MSHPFDSETPPASIAGAPTSVDAGSAEIEPRIFGLLIERIEHLARELGRTEGRQMLLEQQIARLEEQVAALRRGTDLGS
jgi:hypothetical protein